MGHARQLLRTAAWRQRDTPNRDWQLAVEDAGVADYLTPQMMKSVIVGGTLGDREYHIRAVIDDKENKAGTKLYRVRWRHWPDVRDDTWLPTAALPHYDVIPMMSHRPL